ncbi:MAG: hypothetical protein J3K34DRAFT_498328 [Monoraphidium minutum]|nr:MAG: hypothetical protein J3K34DRAFT_498328 [Monoraphidium minutum]
MSGSPRAVKVPRELLGVKRAVLEDYVGRRVRQALGAHARLLRAATGAEPALLRRLEEEAVASLPPPEYGEVPVESLDLQLVFTHDCSAFGCAEPACALCQHSTDRRCGGPFRHKYLVEDPLVARCRAAPRVEVLDASTGAPYEGDLSGVRIEVMVIDGAAFSAKYEGEAARGALAAATAADFDAIAALRNKKGEPLLKVAAGGVTDAEGRVVLVPAGGRAVLPSMHVSDSCEALLQGRRPPFRLLARARAAPGGPLRAAPAVSAPFTVATRRMKNDDKADIPSLDDPVSVLFHVGKETAGKDICIPENTVLKVGDFRALAARADQDGHLRQQLLYVLKLSREKWDETRGHALGAVAPDNVMRAWYPDRSTMAQGLLYSCRFAKVALTTPVALLVRRGEGADAVMEAVPALAQSPEQREAALQLRARAEAAWWAGGHEGWTTFPVDSERYAAIGGKLPPIPMYALTAPAPGAPLAGALAAPAAPQAPAPAHSPPPLPSAHDLIAMMNAGGLTQDTVDRIAEALRTGSCPQDVVDLLQRIRGAQAAAPHAPGAQPHAPGAQTYAPGARTYAPGAAAAAESASASSAAAAAAPPRFHQAGGTVTTQVRPARAQAAAPRQQAGAESPPQRAPQPAAAAAQQNFYLHMQQQAPPPLQLQPQPQQHQQRQDQQHAGRNKRPLEGAQSRDAASPPPPGAAAAAAAVAAALAPRAPRAPPAPGGPPGLSPFQEHLNDDALRALFSGDLSELLASVDPPSAAAAGGGGGGGGAAAAGGRADPFDLGLLRVEGECQEEEDAHMMEFMAAECGRGGGAPPGAPPAPPRGGAPAAAGAHGAAAAAAAAMFGPWASDAIQNVLGVTLGGDAGLGPGAGDELGGGAPPDAFLLASLQSGRCGGGGGGGGGSGALVGSPPGARTARGSGGGGAAAPEGLGLEEMTSLEKALPFGDL